MKSLDDELKEALRREEPPVGFIERVIARTGERRSRPVLIGRDVDQAVAPTRAPTNRIARGSVSWLAAAAVVLGVGGAGIQYRAAQIERARAEQAAGEAARQRVMLALQIAGTKLQLVQSRINRLHEQNDRNAIQ